MNFGPIIKASSAIMILHNISFGQLVEQNHGFQFERQGFFEMPVAIAYDGDRHRMAFADQGRDAIYVFDLTDQTFDIPAAYQGIRNPAGLAFNKNGDLCVTRAGTDLILILRYGKDAPDTLSLAGVDSSRAVHPGRICFDRSGLLYIIDSEKPLVYIIDEYGRLRTRIEDKLRRPGGLAVMTSGEIIVADKGIDPFLIFDTGGQFIRRLSPPESLTDKTSITSAGAAIDRRGWIYSLDVTDEKIIWFDPTGTIRGEFSPEPPFFAVDLSIDRYDNLYILESSMGRVRIFAKE